MTELALSMIVKNASRSLPQCLDSVKEFVQEMVIADTGSSDNTVSIAESFGARVIHIPWNNDFAEARNCCLQEVRSPWILSLDADEVLDPLAQSSFNQAFASPQHVAGFQVTIRNFVLSLQERIWDKPAIPNDSPLPAGKQYPAYVDHQNVRLFRNEKNIHFVGRVHESVGPSLVEQKRTIASADFLIYHFGLALAEEERAAKNRFYRELGAQKLRELPNDAQSHFELGLVELDNFSNLAEALALFSRACALNPRFAQAWFFQGLVLLRQERFREALDCLRKSQRLGHRTAALFETLGDACYNSASFSQAISHYKEALRFDPHSPWVASKLGLALVRSGKHDEGIRHLTQGIERHPQIPELHDHLMLAHLSLNHVAQAADAMETKLKSLANPTSTDFLRAASLCSKVERTRRASQLVDLGLCHFPGDKKLLMARRELSNLQLNQPFTPKKTSS